MSAHDAKRDAKNLANDAETQGKKAKKETKNFWNDIPEDYKVNVQADHIIRRTPRLDESTCVVLRKLEGFHGLSEYPR